MTHNKAKAKADALLKAGDALAKEFPAKSKELLRLCRHWREELRTDQFGMAKYAPRIIALLEREINSANKEPKA